jgi:hypothetical protein
MEVNKNAKEAGVGDMAVLTFQLTGIQAQIKKAVAMRAEGLNELIDREVAAAFTPEKILEAIQTQVKYEFERSMKYGDGAEAVRKIVEAQVAKTVARLSANE